MPSEPKIDRDEIPTEPDRDAMPCPSCKEAGGFITASPAGVTMRRCDYCGGRRKVSLASWRAYRAAQR